MTANEQLTKAKRELATLNAMLTEIQMRGVHEVKIDLVRTLLKPTEEAIRDDE